MHSAKVQVSVKLHVCWQIQCRAAPLNSPETGVVEDAAAAAAAQFTPNLAVATDESHGTHRSSATHRASLVATTTRGRKEEVEEEAMMQNLRLVLD